MASAVSANYRLYNQTADDLRRVNLKHSGLESNPEVLGNRVSAIGQHGLA
jgi:hypothetical protein